jgi:hypothetical protein
MNPYDIKYLLSLLLEERNRLIEESIALASDEDFEVFEAYEEEAIDESE